MGLRSGLARLRESIKGNSRGLLSLLGCFVVHLSLGSFYSFGNLTTYLTSYMKNTTSPDITYGDFVIVPSGNFIIRFHYTEIFLFKRDYFLTITSIPSPLSSLWHVPRHHFTIIWLRRSIDWLEESNHHWLHHIPNRYISNLLYSSTFSCNGGNHLWLLVISWREHCSDTPYDNR